MKLIIVSPVFLAWLEYHIPHDEATARKLRPSKKMWVKKRLFVDVFSKEISSSEIHINLTYMTRS